MTNKLTNLLLKTVGFKPQTIGVSVIIPDKEGKILFEERNRDSLFYPGFLSLPGGILEYGEKLTECGKRETKEELGVDIKIIKQSEKVYETLPSKDYPFHTVGIVLYAEIINGIPQPKKETRSVKWFKPSKDMKLAYNHLEILTREGLVK